MLIGTAAAVTTSSSFPLRKSSVAHTFLSRGVQNVRILSALGQRDLSSPQLTANIIISFSFVSVAPDKPAGSATLLGRLPPPEVSSAWFSDTGQQVSSSDFQTV